MLLTRSRLCPRPKPGSSHHLHVLSTPPAFVLSQDQTLREKCCEVSNAGRSRQPVRRPGSSNYLLNVELCHIGMLSVHKYDNGYDGIINDRPKRKASNESGSNIIPRRRTVRSNARCSVFKDRLRRAAGFAAQSTSAGQPARLSGRRSIQIPRRNVAPFRWGSENDLGFGSGKPNPLPERDQAPLTRRRKRRFPS